MTTNQYENPLISRYASRQMAAIWSDEKKFTTWRILWLNLAKIQKKLGLDITDEQIAEMERNIHPIDYQKAKEYERKLRHDVMSHIHTFGEACPLAKPIIHLGATSCFVTDNTELIQIKESLVLIRRRLLKLIQRLRDQAWEFRNLPTLGFTHFQPAQLTTVGKRFALWLQDFILDFEHLVWHLERLPFRGVKGTTGTQASFLQLFHGDHQKVEQLDQEMAQIMGFPNSLLITGQTYTRKIDEWILQVLSGIAQSAHKMATDLRLLSHLREIEEPFEEGQVGSSAMAYKRNPMRCERICSLSRYVISLPFNTAFTHSTQWMERTLDDSANRRIVLPQAFLAVDAILILATNIIQNLTVWPHVIRRHVEEELPFMATESILMAGVQAGGDRQTLHEAIRKHSMEAIRQVKELGKPNDLLERLKNDPLFSSIVPQLDDLLNPQLFIGRAPQQVEQFCRQVVDPLLQEYQHDLSTPLEGDVKV